MTIATFFMSKRSIQSLFYSQIKSLFMEAFENKFRSLYVRVAWPSYLIFFPNHLFLFHKLSGRRTDYLLITKHSQTLSHHTDQIDSGDSGTYDRQSVAASSNASSTERISDNEVPACTASTALNPVVYTIYGFQYSSVRLYFFHALSILLIGIPYQLFKWFPYACLRFKYRKCDLDESDVIFGN